MYAITGITGKVGGAVARTLLAADQRVRAVVRDADKGRVWSDLGCEVAIAEMEDAVALTRAFTDVAGVFILPPSNFDPAPGFSGEAAAWLFDRRSIGALGSDTFGPDATSDEDFSATLTALQKGGITVENVGPGLTRMRAHGDWVSINGGRPRFSGFQMGITGFTR